MIRSLLIAMLAMAPISSNAEALAGRIWNVEEQSFVAFPDMISDIIGAPYVLIGERHGRTAHQSREAFLLGALVESGRAPALAMEMLTSAQTDLIARYRRAQPEYALELAIDLDWVNSGWPAWSYYYPIFNMAFAAKLPIIGADLPDGDEGAITRAQEIASLEYYRDSMDRAHCGLIDEIRALELARTQMARDQSMAAALQNGAAVGDGAVLIAGSSHVRRDTGIPSLLPDGSTETIMLLETELEVAAFIDSPTQTTGLDLTQYDFIWFTPMVPDTSFCDRL